MGYSQEVIEKAREKLQQRRDQSIRDNEMRRLTFYAICPRGEEAERELAATVFKATKLIVSGSKDAKSVMERMKEENLALQAELKELLVQHGLPEDYLDEKYFCDKCRDTGYIDGKMCGCFKELLQKEACDQLNSQTPMCLCSFDDFDLDYYNNDGTASCPYKIMERTLGYCRSYAENFSKNSLSLIMMGATGLGKTHLSLAIANEAVKKGYGVVYDSVYNFVSKLEKERFSSGFSNDTDTLMQTCDLLILDDLGAEFKTQFTNAAIYNIVNTRLMAGRPTIISTNLSVDELKKEYSDRFVSRVFTGYARIPFAGNDIRVIKRRK